MVTLYGIPNCDTVKKARAWLAAQGVQPGDHVGIYAMNSEQWVSAMLGTLKVRAVPINVNYRYVEAELSYLIDNAQLVACVFDQEYAPRLAKVIDQAPNMKVLVHIEDDSGEEPGEVG